MGKVKIGELLTRMKDVVLIEDEEEYKRVTIRSKGSGIVLRDRIKGDKIGTKRQFLIKEGQFLLSKIDARNGAFGIVGEEVDRSIITGNFWTYEVNKDKLNIDWFNLFVSSQRFIDICYDASSGTTNRKYLDEEKFLNYELTLPSLDEQNVFVDKYFNIKNYSEVVIKEIDIQQQNIKQLRMQVLKDAFKGNLLNEYQREKDNDTSNLLDKLNEEKHRLVEEGLLKKTYLNQKEIPKDNLPYRLPENWKWVRLTEIGELSRGKSKHRPRNDEALFKNGTYPFVQTGDVARSKGNIRTYSKKYNDFGLKQSRLWSKGTLCITIAANIADTGILDLDACFPDSVVGFVPFKPIPTAKYFHYFFIMSKENLVSFAPATAQKNINLEILNNLVIPLPPISEMLKIVNKIESIMSICDEIEEELLQTKSKIVLLLNKRISENVKI